MRSNGKPTSRQQDETRLLLVAVAICMTAFVIWCAWCAWAYRNDKYEQPAKTIEVKNTYPTVDALGPVYTHDSDKALFVYVFTDPDTGQEYLVTDEGGITPRLDVDYY